MAGVPVSGQQLPIQEQLLEGRAQGTTYTIRYYAGNSIAKSAIDSVLHTIDLSMSLYHTSSLISAFNKPETEQIHMDAHMEKVLRKSFAIHKLTNGYFDITVFPLLHLWGFGPSGFSSNPTDEAVAQVMPYIGMRHLKMRGNRLSKKHNRVAIDLNGIAQGYTVDVLGDYLETQGVVNYLVELGGEIKVKGQKANGSFHIAVQRPYRDQEIEEGVKPYIVQLKDKSVTTSGNYENRRKYQDSYISHHLDPKTGRPVQGQTVSATVIADDTMEADALDNYFMYLDPAQAIAFADKQKGVALYIQYYEGKVLKEAFSKGFANFINHK